VRETNLILKHIKQKNDIEIRYKERETRKGIVRKKESLTERQTHKVGEWLKY
jgi:hypothetical protein